MQGCRAASAWQEGLQSPPVDALPGILAAQRPGKSVGPYVHTRGPDALTDARQARSAARPPAPGPRPAPRGAVSSAPRAWRKPEAGFSTACQATPAELRGPGGLRSSAGGKGRARLAHAGTPTPQASPPAATELLPLHVHAQFHRLDRKRTRCISLVFFRVMTCQSHVLNTFRQGLSLKNDITTNVVKTNIACFLHF